MSATASHILPLTGVRFFLALWVVLYHAQGDLGICKFPEPFATFFGAGYVAVGFFFVLSGFILAINYPLEAPWTRGSMVKFGVARFSRIYPVYLLGVVLSAPFVVYSLWKSHSAADLGRQTAIGALNAGLLQSWIPQTALTWNYPGWSLSAEVFFYCCFPAVGVALWRISRNGSLFIAGLLLWAAMLILPSGAVYASVDGDPLWRNLVRFNPLLRLPEFCAGILLAKVFYRLRRTAFFRRGDWLYLPGMALVVLLVMQQRSIPSLMLHNGLLLPLYAMVILGLALGGGWLAGALSVRPIVYLGSCSYSLYIVHVPVALWMGAVAWWGSSTQLTGAWMPAAYLSLAVLCSVCVFRSLEQPANRFLKKRLGRETQLPRRQRSGSPVLEAQEQSLVGEGV